MLAKLFEACSAVLRRRLAVALGCLAVAAIAFVCYRGQLAGPAVAQVPLVSQPLAQPFTPNPEDYAARVVAYIHGTQAITRQELGEYLIHRMGYAKLPTLLNKKIIEKECAARNIVVGGAEVNAALHEKLRGLAIDRGTFIKTVLAKHKKNLTEFKEDDLRPRLMMTRLVANRLEVSPDDLRKAFESKYGEKVEGRMIVWPTGQDKAALEAYPKLRDSESAFSEAARKQSNALAGAGGRIKPIGRYSMDENLEREVFRLRPGEVSELVKTPKGYVLFKCDRRLPADTTVSFEATREKIAGEFREQKLQIEMGRAFKGLRDEAKPNPLLKNADRLVDGPMPPPTQPVAWLWGTQAVTREELGEYLIHRFGGEKLQYLVNRRLIDQECKARNLVVSEEEVDRAIEAHLKPLKMDRKVFEKEILSKWGKSLLEWREDVIRPELMLAKLAEGRAKVTDEDLRKGFEAHHGERVECRMILWPTDQHRFALSQYTTLRDSAAEFDRAAKQQPTPSLASKGGLLPMFGRHCLGDENLEREAFKLQPGEVSPLIGTPQGDVMLKCVNRYAPDTRTTLDSVKAKLTAEILVKKNQVEMQKVFKEIRDKANPRLLLRPVGSPADLMAEAKELLK